MRSRSVLFVLVVAASCAPTPKADQLVHDESDRVESATCNQDDRSCAAVRDPVTDSAPSKTATDQGNPVEPILAVPAEVAAWSPQIAAAAARHDLDPDFVALVVWLESNGRADARSSAGALGLMQLMPSTALAVAQRHGQPAPSEEDLLDPQRNLDLGCAHLAELADQLATEGLDPAAAHRIAVVYNGGPRVLAAWQQGAALPQETERYAAAIRDRWRAHLASR